jgi:hypothetical protein
LSAIDDVGKGLRVGVVGGGHWLLDRVVEIVGGRGLFKPIPWIVSARIYRPS